jgi:hypothetical protein
VSSPSGVTNYTNSALYGGSTGALGIYAYSAFNSAAHFESAGQIYYTLFVKSDFSGSSGGYPFAATNGSNYFDVDNYGDGHFTGYVEATGYYNDVRARDGHRFGAYNSAATRAQIEDVGSAQLVGGRTTVRIDRALAQTIDFSSAYHVFLTPDGDASLYVAQKTPGGFVVRETHGGRSTLSFDYRIVARPVGASSARLPERVRTVPQQLSQATTGRPHR